MIPSFSMGRTEGSSISTVDCPVSLSLGAIELDHSPSADELQQLTDTLARFGQLQRMEGEAFSPAVELRANLADKFDQIRQAVVLTDSSPKGWIAVVLGPIKGS